MTGSGPDPESRDSGFDTSHRPGMTVSGSLRLCDDAKSRPQTRVRDLATQSARVVHLSLALEGVGNAGCLLHPQPRVRFVVVRSTRVTTSTPEHPAFPHAMVLTAYVVLSSVTGLFCHRHPQSKVLSKPGRADLNSANLTPASGRQDHTILPYASASFVSAPFDRSRILVGPALHHVSRLTLPRPPHPHPASVTIAIRPSGGVGCESCRFDLGKAKTGKFLSMGLDSPNHTKSGPSGGRFFYTT
jgi:hypothetical protein